MKLFNLIVVVFFIFSCLSIEVAAGQNKVLQKESNNNSQSLQLRYAIQAKAKLDKNNPQTFINLHKAEVSLLKEMEDKLGDLYYKTLGQMEQKFDPLRSEAEGWKLSEGESYVFGRVRKLSKYWGNNKVLFRFMLDNSQDFYCEWPHDSLETTCSVTINRLVEMRTSKAIQNYLFELKSNEIVSQASYISGIPYDYRLDENLNLQPFNGGVDPGGFAIMDDRGDARSFTPQEIGEFFVKVMNDFLFKESFIGKKEFSQLLKKLRIVFDRNLRNDLAAYKEALYFYRYERVKGKEPQYQSFRWDDNPTKFQKFSILVESQIRPSYKQALDKMEAGLSILK